jgi:hypothetical protein
MTKTGAVLYHTCREARIQGMHVHCNLPGQFDWSPANSYHYMGIANQSNVRCKAKLSLVTSYIESYILYGMLPV